MRLRATGTALMVTTLCTAMLAAPLSAQSADSTLRWSLFAGSAPTQESGLTSLLHNVELGGSADFRWGNFPLPLRASLAFAQMEQRWSGTQLKFGSLSLDAVGHPLPSVRGAKLYFLGGLGLATRAAYTQLGLRPTNADPTQLELVGYRRQRESWALVEGGAGLEFGHAFIQWKLQMPVASEGYVRAPLSIGLRF